MPLAVVCVCAYVGLSARTTQHEPQVDHCWVMSASCCLPWTYSCCASRYCEEHCASAGYVTLYPAWFSSVNMLYS